MYQFQQKELKYHILYFFNPMSQNGTGFRRMTHMLIPDYADVTF